MSTTKDEGKEAADAKATEGDTPVGELQATSMCPTRARGRGQLAGTLTSASTKPATNTSQPQPAAGQLNDAKACDNFMACSQEKDLASDLSGHAT